VVVSDSVVLYYVKFGKVWQNTLKHACPGLKRANGFTEQILGDEICSGNQAIFVLRTQTPCYLGDFTLYEPPKPQQN
jgi:hypothetical protein